MIHKGEDVFNLLKINDPSGMAQFPPNVAKLLEMEFMSYDDEKQIIHAPSSQNSTIHFISLLVEPMLCILTWHSDHSVD